jgi:regulator of protease activity HflC (stomatin/prohibitin superfamily)
MTQSEIQLDPEDRPSRRERLMAWLRQTQFVLYTAIVVCLLVLTFVWPRVFIFIPSGHLGVLYRPLQGGTVTDQVWGEGLHIIAPWNKLYDYEGRLQQETLKFDVLSDEGLTLGLEVAVRFRPNRDMLGYLHKDIGSSYFNRLIEPEVEAHARRTFGSRAAHELYSSAHGVLQELEQIPSLGRFQESGNTTSSRPYVHIQQLMLTSIHLPKLVEGAIGNKYRQEQLMLEYKYKLEREEKEAERKRIEAAGIRDYKSITGRIPEDILRWRAIDANLELSQSPNSKVVVMGGGSGGLPLLMNIGDSTNAPTAPAPSVPPPTPPLTKNANAKGRGDAKLSTPVSGLAPLGNQKSTPQDTKSSEPLRP